MSIYKQKKSRPRSVSVPQDNKLLELERRLRYVEEQNIKLQIEMGLLEKRFKKLSSNHDSLLKTVMRLR